MFSKKIMTRLGIGIAGGLSMWGMNDARAETFTCRKVFQSYASIAKDDQFLMTVDDFVRSLLHKRNVESLPEKATAEITRLFKNVDSDSDGLLSFQEYSLFMTLLTNERQDIEYCFRMFDFDNSCTVELEEFKAIVKSLANDPTVQYSWEGGLVDKFFKHKKSLTFDEFYQFVISLKQDVVRAEFHAYNPSGKGTYDSFAKLLLRSHELPPELQHNQERIQELDAAGPSINISSWMVVSSMLGTIDSIADALEIWKRRGNPINKVDFVRAVTATSPQCRLTRKEVELFFLIFGDEEGCLNDDLFIKALRGKKAWGMRTYDLEEPQRNFVQTVLNCVSSGGVKD
eukprot:TRINITY_DN2861_c0_g1_i12.p1 TRINITY_DN2861_c0_g1~~TRINITY_DN2861_c0_g1_i12.p1  ORF type:complete len:361 (+),score=68.83 TRINITY_DN2861_c0_g1_i12:56-1084(+)